MLSYYAYAVYDSREANGDPDASPVALFVASRRPEGVDNDQAYYQEMISAANDGPIYPGCLINPCTYEVMLKPQFQINKYDEATDKIGYNAVDGTTVNLYSLDGKSWRLASYNSWDISSITEYSTVYLQYLLETLQHKGVNIDLTKLDPSRMYPITFCNPRVHLMTNTFALYYWGDDLEEFDPVTHHLWDKPVASTPSSKCVIVKGESTIDIYASPAFRHLSNILYQNRSKYAWRKDNYRDAIRRHAYAILFDKSICFNIKDCVNANFNRVLTECESMADEMARSFDVTKFRGVSLPERMRTQMTYNGMKHQVYDYRTIPLLVRAFK